MLDYDLEIAWLMDVGTPAVEIPRRTGRKFPALEQAMRRIERHDLAKLFSSYATDLRRR